MKNETEGYRHWKKMWGEAEDRNIQLLKRDVEWREQRAALQKKLDDMRGLAKGLVDAFHEALKERIIGHPQVEAGAMEDLEVKIAEAEEVLKS